MIRNIIRFPDMFQKTHAMVGMVSVSSVSEAEIVITLAGKMSLPMLVVLDLGKSRLTQIQTRYLADIIQSVQAVVGLVAPSTRSLEEAKELVPTGVSLVTFDVSQMSYTEAREQGQFLRQLAHSQGVYVELIIGSLTHESWKSVGNDMFQVMEVLRYTEPDIVGFHLPSRPQYLMTAGVDSERGDVLREVKAKTNKPIAVHGGWIGAHGIPEEWSYKLQEQYQARQGITEHQCMRLASRGVRYLGIEHDIPYLVDAAIKQTSENQSSVGYTKVAESTHDILKEFFHYTNKLCSKTYELS